MLTIIKVNDSKHVLMTCEDIICLTQIDNISIQPIDIFNVLENLN